MYYEVWEIDKHDDSAHKRYYYVGDFTSRQGAVECVTKAITRGIVITMENGEVRQVQDAHEFASENV